MTPTYINMLAFVIIWITFDSGKKWKNWNMFVMSRVGRFHQLSKFHRNDTKWSKNRNLVRAVIVATDLDSLQLLINN